MNTTHYLCGVDYQHEYKANCASIYDSLNELKTERPCWRHCGIVELVLDSEGKEVSHRWIEEQVL